MSNVASSFTPTPLGGGKGAAKSATPTGAPLPSERVASYANQQISLLNVGLGAPTSSQATSPLTADPQYKALLKKLGPVAISSKGMGNKIKASNQRLAAMAAATRQKKMAVQRSQGVGQSTIGGGAGYGGRARGGQYRTPQGLTRIGNTYLRAPAASSFQKMAADFRNATGGNLTINEGWRSYDEQVRLYNLFMSGQGNVAARPGTSNHGAGNAVDMDGHGGRGSARFNWLLQNAPRYGWSWETGRASGEDWHWEYVGS